MKCFFVTKETGVYTGGDDSLLASQLQKYGWNIAPQYWDDPNVNWSESDVTLIRSPWDYYLKPSEFLSVLKKIDDASVLLLQSYQTIKGNIDKRYLGNWSSDGIPVIPTRYIDSTFRFDSFDAEMKKLSEWSSEFGSKNWIVKPTISAGSVRTHRVERLENIKTMEAIQDAMIHGSAMIQPFLESIQSEGEWSLIFLKSQFYHCVRKIPTLGDFRVQIQHGGHYSLVDPPNWLIDESVKIIDQKCKGTLYARLDWVRSTITADPFPFRLMECEMIEPDLYLRMTPTGIADYAEILVNYVEEQFSQRQ